MFSPMHEIKNKIPSEEAQYPYPPSVSEVKNSVVADFIKDCKCKNLDHQIYGKTRKTQFEGSESVFKIIIVRIFFRVSIYSTKTISRKKDCKY